MTRKKKNNGPERPDRRRFLKTTLAASAAGATGLSLEERALLAGTGRNAGHNSTQNKALPTGRLGDTEISRVICGGNLISGFAHDRDLIYVSSLLKHYFTDEKVLETLQTCRKNGINAAVLRLDQHTLQLIRKYREAGIDIKWIAQVKLGDKNITDQARVAIDNGAAAVYLHGGVGDRLVEEERLDVLAEVVDFIKEKNVPAGVGGHKIDVPIACEGAGINVDFYMKTLHRSDYWSFTPEREHDNVWSSTPRKTIEFMKNVDKPWIAYKVLAAGAVHPRQGFEYAFKNGADFVCVGMFDFQVREDADIARQLLTGDLKRRRPWRA